MTSTTNDQSDFILGFGLEDSIVVITGGAGQIGQVIVRAFLATGSLVYALDINTGRDKIQHARLSYYNVDTTNEESMRTVFEEIETRNNKRSISVCVCAAALDLSFVEHQKSIVDMPVEQFRRTLDVNTVGTFITSKQWLASIRRDPTVRNPSLILIGSEAGVLGVPGNADYAASKSAVQYGLMLSLAPDATRICGRARVNAIAPGAVDTPQFRKECEQDMTGKGRWVDAEATVATGKAVSMEAVARMCLLLASERYSASVTGQMVRVDGGKSGRVFWDDGGSAVW